MATFTILAVSQETLKKCVTEEYTEGNQLICLKGQNMKNKRKQSDLYKHFWHMPFNISKIFEHGELF